jgi:hypothetical protein
VRVLSFRRSDCLGRVRGLNDEPAAFFRGECERRLYRIIWRIDGGIQPDGGVSDLVGYVFSSRVTERRGFAGSVLAPVRTWRGRFFGTDRGFYGRRVHSGSVHETSAKVDRNFRSFPNRNWCVELVQLGFPETVFSDSADDFRKHPLDDRGRVHASK